MNNLLASRMGRWSNSMSVVCQVILGLFLLYKETSWLRHAGLTFGRANPRTSRRDDLMVMLCPYRMFRGSVKPPPAATIAFLGMVKNSASPPFSRAFSPADPHPFRRWPNKRNGRDGAVDPWILWIIFGWGKLPFSVKIPSACFAVPAHRIDCKTWDRRSWTNEWFRVTFVGPFFKATGNSKIITFIIF